MKCKNMIPAFLLGLISLSAVAQTNITQRTINVSGTAQLEVIPDEIYVHVVLREFNRKNGDKVDLNTIRNNFLAGCKSIGLTEEAVSVVTYDGYINNNWWWRKRKKEEPDMKASITYQVKLSNVEKMNELADKLEDDATENFNIHHVWHSQMEQLKKQLKIEAIKAARDKALYLTAAIGETVGKAITITDPVEFNTYPPTMVFANKMMRFEDDANAEASPLNVDFKKIKLQFDVSVVFELL